MLVKPIFKTQSVKTVKNICPVDLKKSYFFNLAVHLHLQRWCQPHLGGVLLNQLPARSHELQPGKWWTSSRLRSDSFASFVLTYIAFFFPIIFPPRPPAAAMGTIGRPKESLRDLSRCDCKSSNARLKKSRMLARTETYDDWYEVTGSHVAKGRKLYDHLSKI